MGRSRGGRLVSVMYTRLPKTSAMNGLKESYRTAFKHACMGSKPDQKQGQPDDPHQKQGQPDDPHRTKTIVLGP